MSRPKPLTMPSQVRTSNRRKKLRSQTCCGANGCDGRDAPAIATLVSRVSHKARMAGTGRQEHESRAMIYTRGFSAYRDIDICHVPARDQNALGPSANIYRIKFERAARQHGDMVGVIFIPERV